MSKLIFACIPPLTILNINFGILCSREFKYSYTSLCDSAAEALIQAKLTPRVAFAPSLLLFGVPS